MSTPLGVACTAGDTLLVIDLLGSGHSADEPLDAIGRTPLMVASSPEVIDVLLEAGASLDPMSFGADALQVVVSGDQSALGSPAERIRAARTMLEHGASLDRRNEHGWSRLYSAAFANDPEAVDALLALGAAAHDDPPPLAAACWGTGDHGTAHVIGALVAFGADVHRPDRAGWSLLHAAAMPYQHGEGYTSSDGPNVPAVLAMIEHGVPPDVVGPDGLTALMLVAGDGALDAVDALLAAGAEPDRRDDRGRRAIDHALDSERRLTELLETAAADTSDAIRTSRDSARACVVRLTSA